MLGFLWIIHKYKCETNNHTLTFISGNNYRWKQFILYVYLELIVTDGLEQDHNK